MRLLRIASIGVLALASTACFGLENLFNKLPTSSSETTTTSPRSYLGTWTGPALSATPSPQTCGGIEWRITSQTSNQITGDFSASCAGGLVLAGTLVATTTDSTTIPWAASGSATQGGNSCSFTLTGTGTFQGTSNIVVNYSGTACGIPLSGSQTITRS